MKRIITLMLLLIMCCTVTVAQAKDWTCPKDGSINSGKYCYQCGKSQEELKPAVEEGSIIKYGHYEQDNDPNNGKEEIEWIVLKVEGNNALLLSRYALDCKPYNTTQTRVTWETCSLRTWLNGEFIKAAFTTEEQRAVLTTTVDNSKSQGYYDTNGGKNTQDKVFLLSYTEAWKYFKNDDARKCQPTKYAVAQKAFISTSGNCWWWLRSPGSSSSTAALVGRSGARIGSNVNGDLDAVRPAFWLDLTSDIF